MKRIIMAAMIVSLAACGGDKDDVATEQQQEWEAAKASLVYSFPDNGQQQVPTSSPVVLRFSSPVVVTNAALMDLIELRDGEGDLVEWDRVEEADGGQSLLLYPENNLNPLTDYDLSIAKIDLEKGDAEARNLNFSTRAAYEGPKSQVAEDEFRILRTIPNGEDFDVLEFTTFRVQFSQPLDRSTVIYGDGADATVQLTGPEGAVDAHVLVSGPYLTIDPKEDLEADTSYTLTFTTGLKSIYGENMPGGGFGNPGGTIASEMTVTAKATGPRGNMVQIIADTAGQKSPLTGKQINEVPMASVLLGEDTATQASGVVTAELAFVPDFPDATPLRVKRGSLIEGASIEVLIGGEVPAGFESGKVSMEFLSDATGYLLPNPYSDADDAPRQVRLWMDVAVSTETPSANGAITQDLLHIELVGTSLVEDGRMVINAVGVVEPDVLGSERATGLLSFYMEEAANQDNPPAVSEDTTGPVLQSWIPGGSATVFLPSVEPDFNIANLHKPSDPIIFNFNEPIDPESIKNRISLRSNGNAVEIDYFVDGSALIIKPKKLVEENEYGVKNTPVTMLNYSMNNEQGSYLIEINGLADLAGNSYIGLPLVQEFQLSVNIDNKDIVNNPSDYIPAGQDPLGITRPVSRRDDHSPIILAVYPGYPCALEQEFLTDQNGGLDPARNLAANMAGRCAGGHPGISDGTIHDNKESDDIIPVSYIPKNRPIIISFSKEIDPQSVVLGYTFKVEKITDDEDIISAVKGRLAVDGSTIVFNPEIEWEMGSLYRYTILSSGYSVVPQIQGRYRAFRSDANYECGVDTVCDRDGLPLQTQPIGLTTVQAIPNPSPTAARAYNIVTVGPAIQAGGPDFAQFFRGADSTDGVLQLLTTQPTSDVNRNFMIERTNLGTTFSMQGNVSSPYTAELELDIEEYGPTAELASYPISDPDGEYDPGGVKPSPNSAKLLSKFRNPTVEDELQADLPMLLSLNVGCGLDIIDILTYASIPMECPEHKFTYLISSLIAEVTDEVSEDGVVVKIWPSMVVGTSLNIVAWQALIPGFEPMPYISETGKQILRMRYAGSERNAPIIGHIVEVNGKPVMKVELDLYLDVPYASAWGVGAESVPNNMRSYEISMKMEGDIEFLEDGRMRVEQFNTDPIDVEMRLYNLGSVIDFSGAGSFIGYADLFIPEYGSRLNYLSEPIK